ncbi:SRPBCC family protein [Actinomycetospora rhizophila]|uniref:SRPBCC family protein n=1 Tax=Actinomycetospora rhizophila TaxID=1416876 RepID=A0ABV9ZBK5_9PSEU
MIYSELELPANPPGATPLDRDRIWQGLEQKALDAVPYVEAITGCREIARHSDTVFDREIELGGARYVERVWLDAPHRVVFTRLDGPVLGTITNEITEDDGELGLRFRFALATRPGDELPITEEELSRQMVAAYRAAVETTLAAVRARTAEPVR